MKYAREFMLPLAGLPLGETRYTFDLERPFFELHADEEVSDARLKGALLLAKRDNMIELIFSIKGWMGVDCDRCGDNFHQEVEGEQELILKYGEQYEEESDEVLTIPVDLHEFDISHLLYEYIILLLPYRKIHPDNADGSSTCNAEVLKRLEQMRKEEAADPRWEALKKLKNLS